MIRKTPMGRKPAMLVASFVLATAMTFGGASVALADTGAGEEVVDTTAPSTEAPAVESDPTPTQTEQSPSSQEVDPASVTTPPQAEPAPATSQDAVPAPKPADPPAGSSETDTSSAAAEPTKQAKVAPQNKTTVVTLNEPVPEVAPSCVDDVTFTYDYGGGNLVRVTASADTSAWAGGEVPPLCDPFSLRAALQGYVLPAAGTPSWPQFLEGYQDSTMYELGTVGVQAPPINSCSRYAFYGALESDGGAGAIDVSFMMDASEEPSLISDLMSGTGGPTEFNQSSEGCANEEPEHQSPAKVETVTTDTTAFQCGDPLVATTTTVTTTPYIWTIQSGSWIEELDTANATVETTHGSRALTDAEVQSCKPTGDEIPAATSEKSNFGQWLWQCGDTTAVRSYTLTETTWTPVLVSGSTWEVQSDTTVTTETESRALDISEYCVIVPNPPQFADFPGTADDEAQIPSDTEYWTYEETWDGNVVTVVATAEPGIVNDAGTTTNTWTYEFSDEDYCVEEPGDGDGGDNGGDGGDGGDNGDGDGDGNTPGDGTTPPGDGDGNNGGNTGGTGTGTTTGTTSGTSTNTGSTSDTLAMTGAPSPFATIGTALGLIAIGGLLFVMTRRRPAAVRVKL